MEFAAYRHQYAVQFLGKNYDQNGLEVDFRIVYDDKSKTNTSQITMWNLSPQTLDSLVPGTPIILLGGWPGSTGIIFSGEVVSLETEITGTGDTPTTIYVAQDRKIWFKSTVNKEWQAPITTQAIVKDLVNNSPFTLGFFDTSIDYKYKRNWSFNGQLKDALAELAADCGARAYNEDGRIFFMLPGKSAIQHIQVRPEHILDSPRKTTKGNWKFKTILRWEARPGTVVDLKSKFLEGSYVVLSVLHRRSGDKIFITEWEVADSNAEK